MPRHNKDARSLVVILSLLTLCLALGCSRSGDSTQAVLAAAEDNTAQRAEEALPALAQAEAIPVAGSENPKGEQPAKEVALAKEATPAKEASPRKAATTPQQKKDAGNKVPLIPREVFFGNPDKIGPDLSPDGRQLAFVAPLDGVLNLWVAPIDDIGAARAITRDKHRGITSFFWAFTAKHILYTQDKDGDENWNVYCVDLETDKIRDLTPPQKPAAPAADGKPPQRVRAEIESVSHRFPEEILIGLNDRDPRFHDVYRLNILTGERKLIQKNPGYRSFIYDEDYRLRFASKFLPDGGLQYYQPASGAPANPVEVEWQTFMKIPNEDTATTRIAGFDKSGDKLYLIDSRGRNTGALKLWDLKTDKIELIAEDQRTDVGAIKSHPTDNTIQAVTFYYEKRQRKYFDPEVEKDVKLAGAKARGDMGIASWSMDDRKWIVADLVDNGPVRYFHLDRDTKKMTFLFVHNKDLEGLPLAKMHPEIITARDGLKLVSYLTLPVASDPDGDGRPDRPVPMVLSVHGGPWARDRWGYDGEAQLLANRGYAVLSVNFRGSTGFGKEFQNIAKRQWAGTMHDDLIDAVNWAVKNKIAQKDKVAIMGGSYGGYATLVGLTFTPDVFACGVDIVGPSSLLTLIRSIPPYWESFRQQFIERVGNIDTPEGRELLKSRSPLYFVDRIKRPLLIGQGKNDPRVKEAEAEQMVTAMQKKDIPVTYVLFPDEGHGFARPENRLAFYAVTEHFLARHLGGRAEPIGTAFKGSSIRIPNGAEDIPGLDEAFSSTAAAPATSEK